VGFATLTEFDKAYRDPEESGDPEGLVVSDAFEISAKSLGAGIDAEKSLSEGAFVTLGCRGEVELFTELLHRVLFHAAKPEHAFLILYFGENFEELFEVSNVEGSQFVFLIY
jgi:hypothetical protein